MSDAGQPGESQSPSAYREKNPYQPPPREYEPASFLREHGGLALVFTVIAIAFAVYCLRAPRAPRAPAVRAAAPAAAGSDQSQPIYIDTVPEQKSR